MLSLIRFYASEHVFQHWQLGLERVTQVQHDLPIANGRQISLDRLMPEALKGNGCYETT